MAAVYGGSDMRSQMAEVNRGVDIVVGTPGRLLDFVNKEVIRFDSLKVTCLDEADEMLKQGFQEDIEKIFAAITKSGAKKTQNLLFSATIPPWVSDISSKYQNADCKFVDLITGGENTTSKTVKHLKYKLQDYDTN